jgi:hypothetical protein
MHRVRVSHARDLGIALVLAGLVFPPAALAQWPPAPRTEWDAELSIYAWLWSADGTAEVTTSGGTADASFGDLDGPFDPGASVRVETRSKYSALMAGVTYLHMDQAREVETPEGTTHGELNTRQVVLDAGAGYRLAPAFEILGAARYYIIRTDGSFGADGIENEDRSWMDVFLGGRLTNLYGPWSLSIRGDIGAGGSNLAWFGNAVVAYRASARTSLRMEYRFLSTDRGGEGSVHSDWDVMESGLGLGIGFGF